MSGESILVIEDNALNLKLVRTLLDLEGFDVRTATNGDEALAEIARGGPPRVALVDIQLPGMDGVELARRIREDRANEDVVLVALTAYAMKGDEARFLAAGFDGYLAKPIDQATFTSDVRRFMESGRQRREP